MQALVPGWGRTHPPHIGYLLQAVTSLVMIPLLSDTPFLFPDPLFPPSPATPHHCSPHAPSAEPLPHMAIPSLLEHLQPAARGKENQAAHSYREDFFKPVRVPAHQARTQVPHITSSQLLDTWGRFPSLQLLAQAWQKDYVASAASGASAARDAHNRSFSGSI